MTDICFTEDAPHILLVDDDARLAALAGRYLSENGFRVTRAASAAEARVKLRAMEFDLMVLDVMMPGESGLDLTGSLRAERAPAMPILLLTARDTPEDVLAGFEAGADDYLGKPFDPRVLVARLRAMLRRAQPPTATTGPLKLGEASFDSGRGELIGPNSRIRLTGAELALLTTLAAHPHEVFSREALAATLGLDDVNERAIDVQVTRLRRKIEPDPREPRFLQTVRGKGYVLKPGP
ncbi:response regulator transcription factor [Acidocella aminolytica]|jgi:two-component system phosphate regulon response regulator OmpR|uniref:Two component transcriptional regulator n=1 Tax=Acidocella aminolytica 101 = DSM 11237 TaxID=1120923 RepID=A0A0D6PJK4_9PROT|nr:response regulator transcription factor [Acidocella aminolytica]GAN80974.1 two component transcriptional regulator [Acidocella aminolytica 101 = DSM 11237]GBQ37129.1 two component response regulator OmpR [Acidocella aminolytica 101 = DSM 11237]SHF31036.1 two-component system, OmpR family, phosphate regulon response regulator OmpR [Acidocella aminolytica 101 = DSM 11237]